MDEALPRRNGTNGLGIAGFIISLVGLCGSGGLLCPIGLILSLIALGKQPRGFAVAGVIIGALGSCGIILAIVVVPVALAVVLATAGLTAAAVGLAAIAGPQAESQVEMFVISTNVEEKIQQAGGALPASLEAAGLGLSESQTTDPWGHGYVYEVTQNGGAYRLFSMGPDGVAATPDDVRYEWRLEVNNRPSHVDPSPASAPPTPGTPTESPSSEEEPKDPGPPTGA